MRQQIAFVSVALFFSEISTADTLSERDAATRVQLLLDDKQNETALALAKQSVETYPESILLRKILAEAYLANDNEPWALRSLNAARELDPKDCEPLLIIAWITLNQGNPDEARTILTDTTCESPADQFPADQFPPKRINL